ncbi:MAG: GNAT family N-acetyltransferase [Candidatus Eremiobacteraeota bacterium]|nr:GNAT family N-acetyltransferase [Candidatus Eremiobacteraeota bacterium]MBV9263765.1 GNAT family N-acetyltransferase [Candidatus Eremiobacteraeota bacterium]
MAEREYERRAVWGKIDIARVREAAAFQSLHELLVMYEADLPAELRHGSVPEAGALAAEYADADAAFMATSDGEPIGCVAIKKLDRERAVILRLFVKPRHRGLGAARRLVVAAIEFAKGNDYRRIVLDTHKEQLPAAYALYRSLGFLDCTPYGSVSYACPTFMELALEA